MTGQQDNTRPRRLEVVRDSCQLRMTELEADLRVDATFDEVVCARQSSGEEEAMS